MCNVFFLSLILEEDVADQTIAADTDDPEEREDDSERVVDEGVDRGELSPVFVRDGHHVLGGSIRVLGPCASKSIYNIVI